ncbi:myeloid cell surface antigen CD33-like [Oryx dammah]|uniref:myeloid cell surface antigen CD33-like n=1 Tax=Oryx dammah TaxID=59534 RepID=UPI001A9BE1ED|nr:myeloid cell surface antigen CD33-like [Oryx dammah]
MDPGTLHSSELTLTPRPQDHGTNLTCLVTLQGSQVNLERTVWLNVSYAPRLVTTRISQESFIGRKDGLSSGAVIGAGLCQLRAQGLEMRRSLTPQPPGSGPVHPSPQCLASMDYYFCLLPFLFFSLNF